MRSCKFRSSLFWVLTLLVLLSSTGGQARAYPDISEKEPPPPAKKQVSDSILAYDAWHEPLAQQTPLGLASTNTDPYGYTLDDGVTFAWEDITGKGTQASFSDSDDGFTELIDIGFNFKFYESTYHQLSIGTNGLINFEAGSSSFSNQFLPLDIDPNNLIAPFWDDLLIDTGNVYYWLDSTSPQRFVIEWHQVVKYGSLEELTFQVILYENGDILFQYLELHGNLASSTVGIEDREGVYGLMYLYNSLGLAAGQAILFSRPFPAARARINPLYQSALSLNMSSQLQAQVSNIGDLGSDTINLSALSSAPGWTVSFIDAHTGAPLTDTNGDGKLDSGQLVQGASEEFDLKVTAPASAQPTDYTEITLLATSSLDVTRSMTATVQVAIPAPFAQAYSDSQADILLNQIWAVNSRQHRVAPYFTGTTLAIDGRLDSHYIYAWEKNGFDTGAYYSNVEYTILNTAGFVYKPTIALTQYENEATSTLKVNAVNPAVSVAADGSFALLWIQDKLDISTYSDIRQNSNVWFAILNAQGNLSYGPVNLTNNTQWRGQGGYDIPLYDAPRIVATDDNHFFLGWVDNQVDTGDNEVNRLYYAVYNTAGVELTDDPQLLSQSEAGSTLLFDPNLVSTNSGALFAYTVKNQLSQTYSIAYALLDSTGNVTRNPAIFPGSSGWRSDGARVSNGNLVLAWTNPMTDHIAYVVLNSSGDTLLSGPTDLPLAGMRKPDYVSVTYDELGHAILTWLDVEWNDFMYYAALGGDGSVLTPPMIFLKGASENPLIQTSFSGQGNAPYVGFWEVFLSLVKR